MTALAVVAAVTTCAANVKFTAKAANIRVAAAVQPHVPDATTRFAKSVFPSVATAVKRIAAAVLMKTKGAPIAMKKIKKNETTTRRRTVLRFSPTAWAKLVFLRDTGDSEIGGFGISRADDLLLVEDISLVKQSCTWVQVKFDDESVADFFDDQVDAGRSPEQFGRIWIHTHPGNSPQPSGTDEATFARVFGGAHWAVMFILARGGETYARLRFNVGPGGDVLLPVEVDYTCEFRGSDVDQWQAEYAANVSALQPEPATPSPAQERATPRRIDEFEDDWWNDAWGEYVDFGRSREEEPRGFIRDF
jgi:proteasome lid subunit RPN8/RPN11